LPAVSVPSLSPTILVVSVNNSLTTIDAPSEAPRSSEPNLPPAKSPTESPTSPYKPQHRPEIQPTDAPTMLPSQTPSLALHPHPQLVHPSLLRPRCLLPQHPCFHQHRSYEDNAFLCLYACKFVFGGVSLGSCDGSYVCAERA
jgi:hypothetical protein